MTLQYGRLPEQPRTLKLHLQIAQHHTPTLTSRVLLQRSLTNAPLSPPSCSLPLYYHRIYGVQSYSNHFNVSLSLENATERQYSLVQTPLLRPHYAAPFQFRSSACHRSTHLPESPKPTRSISTHFRNGILFSPSNRLGRLVLGFNTNFPFSSSNFETDVFPAPRVPIKKMSVATVFYLYRLC